MPKFKIRKLNAKRIIEFGKVEKAKKINGFKPLFILDLDNPAISNSVTDELLNMESCALFEQLLMVLNQTSDSDSISELLLNELVIMDFTDLYKQKGKIAKSNIEKLITDGFVIQVSGKDVHMVPFDKSGNMGRNCKISFINSNLLIKINQRLNLDIDFSKIKVNLSKFYAYRGLYLSTAQRIETSEFSITPETLVIIDDIQDFERYGKNMLIFTANVDEDAFSEAEVKFEEPKTVPKEKISVPYDGQGLISPHYTAIVNNQMGTKTANSFQVRLPFAKGMLHNINFHAYLEEFDNRGYSSQDEYWVEDAFKIKRNLKKAHIIMPKSMFKCFSWLKKHCETNGIPDPMQYYCEKIESYNHAMYVSGTDIPYGHSNATHLTYQVLNTLDLNAEQFKNLINNHLSCVKNPIRYIELCNGQYLSDGENEDDVDYYLPTWQMAVITNPAFSKLKYIKNQLTNIQSSLMTKLALGKLVVEGQTRYLARDILFMMNLLIQDLEIRKKLMIKTQYKIFSYRFYLPQSKENLKLDYNTDLGFLRNPHLSRNEQSVLRPLIHSSKCSNYYESILDVYNRYCSHLTGVVMVGNESFDPMALGGADFDGDLVSIIADKNVVDAILSGSCDSRGFKRLPYIKIPSIKATEETVPTTIPFALLDQTFSNRIGIISDAAISIGQDEYGKNTRHPSGLTCAQCTILTGLEIDAAKNGRRPDLSQCMKIEKCEYLKFRKAFDELKKHPKYHFNQLEYTTFINKENETIHKLSIKDQAVKPVRYVHKQGTWINELPIVFMENLNPSLNISCKGTKKFSFPRIKSDVSLETEFLGECKNIISIYSYYAKLNKSIKTDYDYSSNIESLLWNQYDEDKVESIISNDLPYIYDVVANKIKTHSELKSFQLKINEVKWHLLNKEAKQQHIMHWFDFSQKDYTDNQDKWECVLNPYHQGYKLLWYIVMKVCKKICYSDFLNDFNEKKEFEQCDLSKQLEQLSETALRTSENFGESQIYALCLEQIKKVIAKSQLEVSSKIKLLFELTQSKIKEAAFFWDSFSWEEIEEFVVKEDSDA